MSERLQADNSASIFDFTRLVKQVWDVTQRDGDRPVEIYQAYPVNIDVNSSFPVITHMITTKQPSESMPEPRSRIRHIFDDGSDSRIIVTGQRFDYDVLFSIWTETNQEAEHLAEEFEEFMYTYTGLFKRQGVVDVRFQGTFLEPSYLATIRPNQVPLPEYLENKRSRTLIYRVTIERLRQVDTRAIDNILVKIVEKQNKEEE